MMLAKLTVPLALAAGCVAWAGTSNAQPAAFGGPKMLIHGNYCGPGNNAPLPPIDALDAACARHDACTPEGGLPTRACNLRLQREAEMISRDPRVPEKERAIAGMIAIGATVIPSEPMAGPTTTGSLRPMQHPMAPPPLPDDGDDDDGE